MSNSLLKKFAAELKETREKKKLTIDQIFTKTRIDKKFLNAIEEGNFSVLPEVYIRAFVREYSKTIGLEPEETLRKFELAQKNKDYAIVEGELKEIDEKDRTPVDTKEKSKVINDIEIEKAEPVKVSNKTVYYALVGFILLLAIFLIYKTFLTDDNKEIVTEKPFEEIVSSQKENDNFQNKPEQNQTKSKGNEIITPKKKDITVNQIKKADLESINIDSEQSDISNKYPVNLVVFGTDKSWIRVVTDGKNVTEFIIRNNMKKVFRADNKIYLHIGNSGGVKFQLNGKDILFRGSTGRVRKIMVTKNGIEYLRRTPQNNEG